MPRKTKKKTEEIDLENEYESADEGEMDLMEIESIDNLQQLGIGASDITKLKSGGFYTLSSILMATLNTLCSIKGLSEAKAVKIQEVCKTSANFGFTNGWDVLEKRKKVVRLTTGSKNLDKLLNGGLESSSITEAFGEFRTGKTQLAHTLAVTAQLPIQMGGGNGKAIFIDTEGTFIPEKIIKIAERFGVDGQQCLENISYARAFTHEQQIELLSKAAEKMSNERYAIIIVDSATALFRTDFVGRGTLSERQGKLNRFLSMLTKLAETYNVVAYIVNQIVAECGGASMFVSNPSKPIGGNIMGHACTTRLQLRKGRGNNRICKIYDSPCLPDSDCVFALTDAGIGDEE